NAPSTSASYTLSLHDALPISISLAAGVQMAASIPNFLCQEQVSLGEGYITKPFVVKKGYIDVPTSPGLGIELDENALADKIGHRSEEHTSELQSRGHLVCRLL